jgi:hypothetical protein
MEPACATPLQGDYKETLDVIRFNIGQPLLTTNP